MKSTAREPEDLAEVPVEETASPTEVPGIRPAQPGYQPIKDFSAFLQSLPDFGEDAVRLREAIAEDRALGRALAEEDNF